MILTDNGIAAAHHKITFVGYGGNAASVGAGYKYVVVVFDRLPVKDFFGAGQITQTDLVYLLVSDVTTAFNEPERGISSREESAVIV